MAKLRVYLVLTGIHGFWISSDIWEELFLR